MHTAPTTPPTCPHIEAVGVRPDRCAYRCVREADHTGGHALVRVDDVASTERAA